MDKHPDPATTSPSNQETLERFFLAFATRNGEGMASCYATNAKFRDPVFRLQGHEVGAMWRMLCQRGKDLRIESSDIQCQGKSGSANWSAWYTFSATGRSVHNIVHSTFRMESGLIVEQNDQFSFWRWSSQALGPTGMLLGWTPLLASKVRSNAAAALQQFIASEKSA